MADAKGFEPDVKVRARDYRIGCIGAGMIMAECHLAAYREAGFPVAAIAFFVALVVARIPTGELESMARNPYVDFA